MSNVPGLCIEVSASIFQIVEHSLVRLFLLDCSSQYSIVRFISVRMYIEHFVLGFPCVSGATFKKQCKVHSI